MNIKELTARYSPYIFAIVAFIVITYIYLSPLLEGKRIQASDAVQFKGMSKEIVDYREKTGEEALWTNNMFGGMPAIQISIIFSKNLMRYVDKIMKLGFETPARQIFMYFVGFFILLLALRVNPWLSFAGAIGFAFSSYFFIILEAGHNSKAAAIGYMAPVLAGVILTYRGKYIAGGLLTAFFLSLEILSGHPQITYYLLLMVLVYGIIELINHWREKMLPGFLKASGVLLLAAVLAVLTHFASLWGTYEYSKYTIRGKSELTHNKENRTGGLDKDYATSWSYGKAETFTLLIPGFYGGSSHIGLSKNSETYRELQEGGYQSPDEVIKQIPLYWGPQPFTSGPVYVGAIIFFLFILSLFLVKGPLKWWAVAVTVMSILLAWGKNFNFLTDFFLDHFPLYNKFRTVSMILVMAEVTVPLMAILGLQKILESEVDRKKVLKYGMYTVAGIGAVLLFFILFSGSLMSFTSEADAGYNKSLLSAFIADRQSMLQRDAARSLLFVALAAALLWAFVSGKIAKKYVLIALPLLLLADMWPVNKRYLNNDDFEKKNVTERPHKATTADQFILKDKQLYFRVFNLTERMDQSARTSYFHKNLGGYHGAKFRRYQEMIDIPFAAERKIIVDALSQANATPQSIFDAFSRIPALNMLNTKYLIYDNNADPLLNPYALGNAWFVKDIRVVPDADAEIEALSGFNPDSLAIVDQRFSGYLSSHPLQPGQPGTIELKKYSPNKLTYSYDAPSDQFAVFSEIYYDKGWNAYVDGKKVPHIRVNFVLRGMVLPSGSHDLEFRFEPRSYFAGQNISLVSSLLILLMGLGYAYLKYRKTDLHGLG